MEDAKTACAVRRPQEGRSCDYQMGWNQGNYNGLVVALRVLQGWLDDRDKTDRNL